MNSRESGWLQAFGSMIFLTAGLIALITAVMAVREIGTGRLALLLWHYRYVLCAAAGLFVLGGALVLTALRAKGRAAVMVSRAAGIEAEE